MVIFHSYVGLLEGMGQKNVLKPCYDKEVQLKSPDRPSSPVLGGLESKCIIISIYVLVLVASTLHSSTGTGTRF